MFCINIEKEKKKKKKAEKDNNTRLRIKRTLETAKVLGHNQGFGLISMP